MIKHSKFDRFLRGFCIVAAAAIMAGPAAALTESQLDMFAENNIMFYDPSQSNTFCGAASSDCNIMGDTKDEKLWSGLRHVGFTPEQTAAIMGNMAHEGGSPTIQEGVYNSARDSNCLTQEGQPYTIWTDSTNGLHHGACMQAIYSYYSAGKGVAGIGLGFVQWTSHNRRLGYLEEIRKLNLLKYFEDDAYKTYGRYNDEQLHEKIMQETGSDSDYWALWCAAIHFVRTEMDGDYSEFYTKTTVAELAGWVSARYEVCGSCSPGDSGYNSRIVSAEQYFADYKAGKFDAIESGEAKPVTSIGKEDGSNVTIIGDSITNGYYTRNAITKLLPKADIHAQDSKSFANGSDANPSGVTIAQELQNTNTLRNIVIFALGTNDKGGIADGVIQNLVDSIIGPSHIIYFLTNYDAQNPSIYDNNNAQFTSAAATYGNVRLIDWRTIVEQAKASNPETTYILDEQPLYSVHPTIAGSELFAQAIYDSITGVGRPSNCDNINNPNMAISYLQQFIVDTNRLYNRNYAIPRTAAIGMNTNTPGSDEEVVADAIIQQQWIDRGLITASDELGGCWRATFCGQCTALSGWFVTMMTGYLYGSGNGAEVVANMLIANAGLLTASNTPVPFSVFSEDGSSAAGHTGIVLGVLSDGTYLTMENNQGNHDLKIKKRDNFAEKNATFLNLSSKLKLDHLGTTYE
ncbi:phage tail tip lysozyme [Candidatus Saccharibacteria bacterium]|nr:phage tail tip lysozyme [Candidatus Saccharibacteria bacterium]